MRLFSRNIGLIIGALLCVGLGWWLYLTFFAPLPRWGTMPHEIKRISLKGIAGSPNRMGILSNSNLVYIVAGSSQMVIIENQDFLTKTLIGHQLIPALAVDEQRNRVYVTNGFEDTVTLFENVSQTTTIPVGGTHPEDIAINPKTGMAYVIGRGESEPDGQGRLRWHNYLTVLDGNKVVETRYFTQSGFNQVAVDPINDYLYIGADKTLKNTTKGDVIIFKDLQEVARFESVLPGEDIDVDPQTGDVYVLAASLDLSLFRRGALVATMQIGSGNRYPSQLAFHPVTKDVYVIDFLLQEMVIIREMQEIARLPLGWDPAHMAIDPLTGNVYVANA